MSGDRQETTGGICAVDQGGRREECAAWPACACEPRTGEFQRGRASAAHEAYMLAEAASWTPDGKIYAGVADTAQQKLDRVIARLERFAEDENGA